MKADPQIEERIASLHAGRLIDLHYDLPLSLFLSRPRRNVVATDFLPEFETGDVGLLGVAVYVEDKHLGEEALRVVLDQIALLKAEIAATPRLEFCRTFAEIERAQSAGQIALLLTMEGAEPLGEDLNLVAIFHELGLRSISLTHARENAAARGLYERAGMALTGKSAPLRSGEQLQYEGVLEASPRDSEPESEPEAAG